MAVIASFVVGGNGASALGGLSAPLSTDSDRRRFLARHRSAAAFIIGKSSAQIENYSATTVPIYVITRSLEVLSLPHPMMVQITAEGAQLAQVVRIIDDRVDGDVVVEAGASLLQALVASEVVDLLELSISPIDGDSHFLDVSELLKNFTCEEEIAEDGTRLLHCRYQSNASNS